MVPARQRTAIRIEKGGYRSHSPTPKLIRAGFDWGLVDDLPARIGTCRYAQSLWQKEFKSAEDAQKEWNLLSPAAYDLRNTMVHYFNVLVRIRDNGIGISMKNISNLFKLDKSFSTKGTRDEQGTGLGLLLCKEFIGKHDGSIWAESEPGKGSSFYFTLPV